MPAGRILAAMVLSFGLAALVNADALVQRAEAKPLGAARDRSLAIWHPIQDVAHVTQLTRLRDLGDWLVGNEDRGGAGVPLGEGSPPPTDDRRPILRAPGAGDPLRIYVGGDSILRDAGDAFLRIAGQSPLFETDLHYENATGLSRPDFFDWPKALADDMTEHRPEVVFVLFGGNDAQGLIGPDGTTYPSPAARGWQAEYGRRVGGVMDLLRARDRVVFWIGLPPMRSSDFDGRARIMNTIFEEQAATRAWVSFVDTRTIFGDADGRYVARRLDGHGDLVELRQRDGIHLSTAGADRLARVLLDHIDDELAAAASTTTSRSP